MFDKIVSIETVEFEDSYDFQVEFNENFFYNDILVHNCRTIVDKNGMWSREGKPFYGAPHIHKALKPYFEAHPSLILDGELYNHEYHDNFNALVSIIKKQTPTLEELQLAEEKIQYWIYDVYSQEGSFEERFAFLNETVQQNTHLIVVETYPITLDKVDKAASSFIERGFEGAMIRLNGPYENKRSKFLLKWKEFQDEEFEIVDIQEGDGNRSNMAARVVLKMKDNKTFSAGLIGNVDYCRKLLLNKHKHIGKQGTVIFQNYTPDGIPRFPKFKTVRDYE